MQDDEGRHAAIDGQHVNAFRSDPLEIKNSETDGGCEEACLQTNGEKYRKPHRIETESGNHWRYQRQDDQGEFDPIEEKPQKESCKENGNHDTRGAKGETQQRSFDELIASQAPKYQGECRSTDQYSEYESRRFGGCEQHVVHHAAIEPLFDPGEKQGTRSPHAGSFGRCGHAEKDASEHGKNEERGRNDRDKQILDCGPVHRIVFGCGGAVGIHQPVAQQVDHIQTAEQYPGEDRAEEQVTHAHGHPICHEH